MKDFWFGGDSAQTSGLLNGRPIQAASTRPENPPRNYFEGIDKNDPLITTGEFPDILAQFPPTLVVTGTRDISMSNALMTHTSLLQAGRPGRTVCAGGPGAWPFLRFSRRA